MNRALFYLWFTLLKRRAFQFILGLRRPTTLIGASCILFVFCLCYHYRREEFFGQIVQPASLMGCAMVMLGGALFQGFLQRGLQFDPPDIEFLFTSPFSQRHIVLYRLLPGYLYAVLQAAAFFAIFQSHLSNPWLASACLVLFQVVCFHIAAGAAIFAGGLSEETHYRMRWMLVGIYCLMAALYLRKAWDVRFVPHALSSPLAQILFYPVVTISDLGSASAVARVTLWSLDYGSAHVLSLLMYLLPFALAASLSLWFLLRLRTNIFESSLSASARVAEKRRRIQQGHAIAPDVNIPSFAKPKVSLFAGAGALVWKNLVVASRSRRNLLVAAACTLVYTAFLIALRYVFHHLSTEAGGLPGRDAQDINNGIVSMLACLAFFLQRAFSFDFRRDGSHLLAFRTLPFSPLALTLAELSVPILFCLGFQAFGVVLLMLFPPFDWRILVLTSLGFPAIAVALNGTWNLYYLISAARRSAGRAESSSPVALVMVVTLSFLVFYPAGWAAMWVGQHTTGRFSESLGIATWLGVQYSVDLLVLLGLATLFQRLDIAQEVA